jgi:aminoglycoside/choline kinase family phosphotransferase
VAIQENPKDQLISLFRETFGNIPETIMPIPGSGSNRMYFRLGNGSTTVIGAFNEDLKENMAFLSFTRTFLDHGLPVPAIHAESRNGACYLLDDLGDVTLFSFLQEQRARQAGSTAVPDGSAAFPKGVIPWYRQVLEWLPRFQTMAQPDYSVCYPRPAFDLQSMLWDLNYFKYYYLKLAGIPFDEQHLEDDFRAFAAFLLEARSDYFLYRDFQSRNIMLHQGAPWFIDYQGGRRGALQYDVASLLYDAKADIPEEVRTELVESYFESLASLGQADRQLFDRHYHAFVLIRILQAMGAYGFRGYYEKKVHFLQSIPYALNNLSILLNRPFLSGFPELRNVLEKMIMKGVPPAAETETLHGAPAENEGLTVLVTSFSFKNGLPEDPTANGGGFVFDCRALPNPGRYEEYREFTGRDAPVIAYLEKEQAVDAFLESVFKLTDQTILNYIARNFTHLMVSFGCTGGRHRSVYCAEQLAGRIREKYRVNVVVRHREQDG